MSEALLGHCSAEVEDPKCSRNILYLTTEILPLAMCGALSGADGFGEFKKVGESDFG